jgi:hypothetical protein
MTELVSRNIQPGDPVTAEIINNLVIDLNTVNKAATVSNIVLDNTGSSGTQQSIASAVWQSGPVSVKVTSGTPKPVVFKFGNQKWASAPAVWVQFYIEGITKPTWAQSQIFTQISSVTTTEAQVLFRSASASTINVVLFATGTPVV